MKFIATVTWLLVLLTAASAHAQADESAEARARIQSFATALQAALRQEMESGGPLQAIALCNMEAPAIAAAASRDGWQVGRTALKIRNPANQPDAWEREVLQQFEQRRQAGEDWQTMEASKTSAGEFRFMKAIPTGPLCVACHGAALSAPVAAKLTELYPQDQATGFQPGDLRGAFTLRKTLE